MAVYTPLTEIEITEFLSRYDVGALESVLPIAEGVSNTNYLLETNQDKYILTLFEGRLKIEDLPYFAALMEHLAEKGVPCPLPLHKTDGSVLSALKEKPALLTSFLQGRGVGSIKQEHVSALGVLTANMHIAAMDFPHVRDNDLSIAGWEKLVDQVVDRADEIEPGLRELIRVEFNELSERWPQGLPGGPIHADLFPDNVFFDRGKLTGVIDFYFACNDAWAYDVAICVNAWCFDSRHRFVKERVQALMQTYNDLRPMTPEEEAAMPTLLRGAALRFLLTRTRDWLFTPADALVTRKDPLEYAAKLRFFQGQS